MARVAITKAVPIKVLNGDKEVIVVINNNNNSNNNNNNTRDKEIALQDGVNLFLLQREPTGTRSSFKVTLCVWVSVGVSSSRMRRVRELVKCQGLRVTWMVLWSYICEYICKFRERVLTSCEYQWLKMMNVNIYDVLQVLSGDASWFWTL